MKFQGKKFSFAVVKKKLPNGRYADVDVIEHPGAVVIVPFLSRDTVIFLHQYRPVLGRYLLELLPVPWIKMNSLWRAPDEN